MKFVSLYFVILSFVFIEGKDVRKYSFQADPIGNDEDTSQLHRDLDEVVEDCDMNEKCTGTNACEDSTATIEDGACNGSEACAYIVGTIGGCSCNGYLVCFSAGFDGTQEITIGNNSCRDGNTVCYRAGLFGSVQIGNGSCRGGNNACQYAGAAEYFENGNIVTITKRGSVTIGDNSCREKDGEEDGGNSACENAGKGGTAIIRNNSCRGDNACEGIIATVGNDSCNCDNCCSCLIDGQNVPNDSCNEVEDESDNPQCCFSNSTVGNKNLSPNADGGGGMFYFMFTITQ